MTNSTIQEKANDFAYITFKMQANMSESNDSFYNLESTVQRISSCLFACASGSVELLLLAKKGMIEGFNKLKIEENLPILSYDTIQSLIDCIDNKLELRRTG